MLGTFFIFILHNHSVSLRGICLLPNSLLCILLFHFEAIGFILICWHKSISGGLEEASLVSRETVHNSFEFNSPMGLETLLRFMFLLHVVFFTAHGSWPWWTNNPITPTLTLAVKRVLRSNMPQVYVLHVALWFVDLGSRRLQNKPLKISAFFHSYIHRIWGTQVGASKTNSAGILICSLAVCTAWWTYAVQGQHRVNFKMA